MENFLPNLPEGEDDTTYSRYQQDLKEQHNLHKESRDKSVISILMNKTFAQRICQIKDFNSRLFTFVFTWLVGSLVIQG